MKLTYEQLLLEIANEFPSFKIVAKADSAFMKVLDFLLKLITFWQMKTFMSRYVTTIGCTVYTPTLWETMSKEEVLRTSVFTCARPSKPGVFGSPSPTCSCHYPSGWPGSA